MSDLLYLDATAVRIAILAILTCGAAGLAFWRIGIFTPPAVRAYRMLIRDHGYNWYPSWTDRISRYLPFWDTIQMATNVDRMLHLIGSRESPRRFLLLKCAGTGVAWMVGILLIDGVTLAAAGDAVLPLWLLLVAGPIVALAYLELVLKVRRVRRDLEVGLGDMIAPLSLIAGSTRLSVDDLIQLCALYQRDGTIRAIFEGDRWRAVVEPDLRKSHREYLLDSAAGRYRAIGESYGAPLFVALASTMTQISQSNPDPTTELLDLARMMGARRIQMAEEAAARARGTIQVPTALMAFPMMLLILVPIVAQLLRL